MSVPNNTVRKANQVIPTPQSIYEPQTTQQAPLGTKLELDDRVYYYAFSTASLSAGTLVCSPAPVASAQSGILAMATGAVGLKVLTMTNSASVAANAYAEGYFGVSTGTNGGEMYRVRSNALGTTGATLTIYDGLNTAITSGTNFFLIPNQYNNVKIGSQALDYAVGVVPVICSSSSYFWLQTWGPAAPSHVAATPANGVLVVGTTGGVVTTFDATTNGGIAAVALPIGKNIGLAATAGQQNPVFLQIRP
jgi:hypothetical protein